MSKIEKLLEEFPREQITFRPGATTKDKKKAIPLAYIDARDVMDRLDEIIGVEDWKDEYEFHGDRTICKLSIRINDEWVTKCDGAGDTNIEGEKGGLSDAFKRAAVKWGVGRYLYKLRFKFAPLNEWKRFEDDDLWKHLLTKNTKVSKAKLPQEVKEVFEAQAEAPAQVKNRLITAINKLTDSAKLSDFERNQAVKDARDKLHLADPKLSDEIDMAITQKQASFLQSPSNLT